jgi:small GTP-binding protein
MDLKQYEQWKFAFAEIIRSTRAIDTKDETLRSECLPLLARLAEDKFNLLVVGRFSRGKSTLMNAILGGDHLPTGIVPLTSVITTVRYGTRKQVVLNFSDHSLRREVPLSELTDYVTQKGNPGNTKNIAFAEIELPVEILRRGFFFVDTPGLGSPIVENTLTTERFLPEADAFVLVTSFESALTEDEDRILRRVRNTNRKIFVVVNKQDTVNSEERSEAIQFVEERLKTYSFRELPLVFSVSARQALEAKISRQDDLLEESRLPVLEKELLRFLTEERVNSFLMNMYERTLALLARRMTTETESQDTEVLKTLMKRLRQLRESIFGAAVEITKSIYREETDTIVSFPTLQVDKSTGCSICGSILKAVLDFLRQYQYALTIDPDVQREHAERGGFCSLHTWQYEAIASPYGVCAAYPALTHRIAEELQRSVSDTSGIGDLHKALAKLLPTRTTCRMCEEHTTAEQTAVAELANTVRQWGSVKADHIPVSCMQHLTMVVQVLGDGEEARKLVRSQASLLERTGEDLQRYAIKFEALRRNLTSAEERQAAQLAMTLLAGHRNVITPWVVESIV